MTRVRWVNGNQIEYGAGSWFRYVLDVDTPGDGGISVWWGVETLYSINDSVNNGDTNYNGTASPFSNVSFVHGGSGGVTWLRGEGFWITPGSTVTFAGHVENLAGVSGRSTAGASWTRPALPPNQMAAPVVNNIASTTHQVHFAAPGTNGAGITSYTHELHGGSPWGLVYSVTAYSTPIYASGLTPNQAYEARIRAESAAGPSPWSGLTSFTQAVAVPLAPGTPVVTRNSDTSQSLAWTRASQTEGPYASQEVLRREGSGGAWGAFSVIASLSGTATSYVDATTVANRAYSYEVRATNASGTATSANSGTVWTTPGVPTSQAAAKDAASNIVVTWAAPSGAPFTAYLVYEVSESTDSGGTWAIKTTTAAGALTYTHSAPNAALPHRYRIRAIVSATGEVGDDLASTYVSTNDVQLLTAPAAPTNLQNTPAGTADRAQSILLTWTHNPLDSSPQTKYTLQHRALGSGTWTTTVGPTTTAASSYTLPANAYPTGTAFEWQVLTYGLHANPSPYSAIATVQVSSVPGVSIATPTAGQVVGSTAFTTTWTFSDPDGDPQGSWEATLYAENGATLESRSGADTAATTTFGYRLQEAAYTVKVRVRDSRGLWSTLDTRNFTVSYPLPPTPVISNAAWDWKRGTVELSISVPAPTGAEVAPAYLEFWRSIDDGPLVLLAGNLPPGTLSYVDFTPTVEGVNTYVIQVVSSLPSASQSAPTVVTTPGASDGRPGVWLSGGPGFTKVGRLATEVSVDAGCVRERVLQQYAGRPLPVEHSGEHVMETWQVSGSLNTRWSKDIDIPASPEDWIALGSLEGPFLLRGPALFGGQPLYVFVSVDGPTVSRQRGGNVYEVSFTATRAEGSL